MIQQLPGRLRKKMFAIRSRIEWMVEKYGIEHVGLQTLTIRENVTDRKDFTRRFKSLATNVFPKIYEDWLRVFERQQRGAWHAHVVVVTKQAVQNLGGGIGVRLAAKLAQGKFPDELTISAGINR